MFGLITARRHRAELAAARAEANRQRARAVKAEKAEATANFNRGQVLAQNAELHTANARLEGRNKALGDRLLEAQVASGFNPVAARRTAERIATLQKAAAEGRAEARAERKRADQLQKQFDEAVGLTPGRPRDSAPWQPGYVAPKPDKAVSP